MVILLNKKGVNLSTHPRDFVLLNVHPLSPMQARKIRMCNRGELVSVNSMNALPYTPSPQPTPSTINKTKIVN